MDLGDIIFFGAIAISVISSIAKAVKKKPEEEATSPMPDFKGTKSRDVFKDVIRDILEKEDDYIPRSTAPKPEQPLSKETITPVFNESNRKQKLKDSPVFVRTITENMPRRESFKEYSKMTQEEIPVDYSDPILQNLDLHGQDELKKAILYSEILKPKF